MHRAGQTLLGVGIPLTGLGIVSYIGGLAAIVDGNAGGAGFVMFGLVGIAFGPELIVAGAVLNGIGGKKQKEYEDRLNLKVGLNSIRLEWLL